MQCIDSTTHIHHLSLMHHAAKFVGCWWNSGHGNVVLQKMWASEASPLSVGEGGLTHSSNSWSVALMGVTDRQIDRIVI